MLHPAKEVPFPVTIATLLVHDLRALLDAHPIGDLTPPQVTPVTPPLLLLAAQIADERAAASLVGIDVEIDALVTDARTSLGLAPPGDLLGTPVLPY